MKGIYYTCIVIGLFVVLYVQVSVPNNRYFLIGGITMLMYGLYHISKALTSKKEDSNFIKTEHDEEE